MPTAHVPTASELPRRQKVDFGYDLAVPAWLELCRRTGRRAAPPPALVTLKRQKAATRKSGVYRLEGVGDDGAAVIAKRCRRATALVERHVYEHVLPALPISSLRYYGYIEERDDSFCWLFMGDAGAEELPPTQHALAGEWLAGLHTSAAGRADLGLLPERGPEHYLEHLHADETWMAAAMTSPARTPEERDVFASIFELLRTVRARWEQITGPCAACPRTLVHGDFIAKNLRQRTTTDGAHLVALDWETAGCGSPAVDLHVRPCIAGAAAAMESPPSAASLAHLDGYASVVARAWPTFTRDVVEQLSRTGTIFRLLVSVRWATEKMDAGADDKGMNRMRQYVERFPIAIEAALMG